MCEFKVKKKSDGFQITEDIVIANYAEDYGLVLKDILGMPEVLNSALIWDVNTLNQTLVVIEHSLIKDFLALVNDLNDNKATKENIDTFITQLTELKKSL